MAKATGASRLRDALGERLVRAMACHSPLSAILAEQAGFDALWASGFELSALYGLPDASLITMAEHLQMVRAIAPRCALPIVADIDTGFGNAINASYAMREYERAGAAAVVIEDKSFPKMTSLVAGGRQQLVRIAEFQGKIEAMRAARSDPDMMIIARTEALIAELGLDEALERAAAYEESGADLILVHSKQETPDEVESFVRRWKGRCGVVLIPTAYPQLGVARARSLRNVSMIIYGNHAIRASVAGMRHAFAKIAAEGGSASSEMEIASVAEIFELQRMSELKSDEDRFLR